MSHYCSLEIIFMAPYIKLPLSCVALCCLRCWTAFCWGCLVLSLSYSHSLWWLSLIPVLLTGVTPHYPRCPIASHWDCFTWIHVSHCCLFGWFFLSSLVFHCHSQVWLCIISGVSLPFKKWVSVILGGLLSLTECLFVNLHVPLKYTGMVSCCPRFLHAAY